VADLLAVPVPELLARDRPSDRPAQGAAEGTTERRIEQDDRVGALEDERSQLRAVVAVDYPAVGRGIESRTDACLEHVGGRLVPAGVVVQGVELDVRDAERCRELVGDGRLAGA